VANLDLHDLKRRYDHLAGRTVSLDTGEFADGLQMSASADREAVSVLLRERLRVCLRQLDQIARSVILAHYFRGLTLRELTEQLRLSNPSGSHAVLIGAQRKLRRCLERGRDVCATR
jgi:DNA-directed RNA polymerase specialized sigma24 family protein